METKNELNQNPGDKGNPAQEENSQAAAENTADDKHAVKKEAEKTKTEKVK